MCSDVICCSMEHTTGMSGRRLASKLPAGFEVLALVPRSFQINCGYELKGPPTAFDAAWAMTRFLAHAPPCYHIFDLCKKMDFPLHIGLSWPLEPAEPGGLGLAGFGHVKFRSAKAFIEYLQYCMQRSDRKMYVRVLSDPLTSPHIVVYRP